MKFLILICTLTGLGWLGIDPLCEPTEHSAAQATDSSPLDCDPVGCDVEVECTPQGTCLVTCTDGSGRVCTFEVECTAPDCDPPECDTVDCDPANCDPADCTLPCSPGGSATRSLCSAGGRD